MRAAQGPGEAEAWRESVDLQRLDAWMQAQGFGPEPIAGARLLSGGTQNILLGFAKGGRRFVLRRPPPVPRPASNDTMRREARVLAALADTDVPHPRLIAACPDEGVLGVAFYLMEPVAGFNATVGLPEPHRGDPAMRHAMGLALVDGAAALGRVDYLAVGLRGFGKPDNYLARQVERWRGQLASYADQPGWPGPAGLPGVERVARYLEANRPSGFSPGIIHGDYHLANVMFRPDSPQLAAIVDWELTTIGDPLLDLGWILATWRGGDGNELDTLVVEPWDGFPTAAELVARYAQNSERDVSAIDWYTVLACYKLGIILEGTYARACAGRAPVETGARLHTHAVHLFRRALLRIG
ncbi:MAG: phosphotransferase family protein [Nevskia sp.]|nr:phosphotransferase family protein [Nevskia sp.]